MSDALSLTSIPILPEVQKRKGRNSVESRPLMVVSRVCVLFSLRRRKRFASSPVGVEQLRSSYYIRLDLGGAGSR